MGREILRVLGYIALGMAVSEFYNFQMWRKYREGLQQQRNAQDTHYSSPRYGGGRPK